MVEVVLVGIILLFVLSGLTIWHVLALRKGQVELANGIGMGVKTLLDRLEVVEAIPEVLQELNLGGVTLQPNKTVGEMIFETIVARMTGDSTNDFNPLRNLNGPTQDYQENNPPETGV
tara:strand:+ start:263 stop:616 length:354 start_codon:yes stop_codon:yes gene_type:complete